MLDLDMFTAWVISSFYRVRGREPERGDVPGWVMVTIMTAGLVVVIFAAFKGRIVDAINNAVDTVVDKTK